MRCRACNCLLTDPESVRRDGRSGEYMDMCNACLSDILDDLGDTIDPEDELWDSDYPGAEEEEDHEEQE